MSIEIPSAFQLDQKVQVVFPNNGKLQGKVVKISFTNYGKVLYDVEIPFASGPDGEPEPAGHFRIHGVDNWFISHTQED